MKSMENENKVKNILTDEELKEVAGGVKRPLQIMECQKITNASRCSDMENCVWKDGVCMDK
jgi:hypothetical protein